MRLTTQGIVLRETNYKEADKILTVLTRDLGKRTVKARGRRRKNSKLTAASQLLVYSEMTLSERGGVHHPHRGRPSGAVLVGAPGPGGPGPGLPYFAEVTEATPRRGGAPEPLSLPPQLPLRPGHLEETQGPGEGGL